MVLNNIIGQPVLPSLLQAIKKQKLSHALLFAGPSGVGKTTSAWGLSQVLLCTQSDVACGECPSCQRVANKKSEWVLFIQPEGLFIKVESIRQIMAFLSLQSFAPARVVIIEEAHQMNKSATGALLKILEEPPNNVYFFLTSSHLSALATTIKSRTQTVRFVPLQHIPESQKNKTIDKWMFSACQGRMDLLEELTEKTDLRNLAFALLKQCLKGEICSMSELADLVKNRKQALFVCLCWQQIERDAKFSQLQSSQIIHADQKEIIDMLQKLPPTALNDLFMQTVHVEQGLKSYVDSTLLFDNLLLFIKHHLIDKMRLMPLKQSY